MTTAETITEIRDIVFIVFLIVALIALVLGLIFSIRLYYRINRFIDRLEHVVDRFEGAFTRVIEARQMVEEVTLVLKPLAKGLGIFGAFTGIGKMFKRGSMSNADTDEKVS
ncbi:MAG: hypothetical protein FI699_08070 [SAR202 cluster bacterium]|nr:hypothetical protein [Chloroflexota bacterium]MQG88800.1 hypothetical protein [SAR202 cluster bacterium]|tara:strand:+ start:12886 stop:13218 length:333 start_codon:yes stop_codon:yes gene_type:complete